MINNFLIIKCIGNNDKLGLRINKEFFIHELKHGNNEKLVSTILNVLNTYNVQLDENFTVIVNQGPGSFSSIRISLSVARGLEISKKVKIFGYKNEDLTEFNQENIEKLLINKLIEKNLIKPIYLS
tara:strand:+ start:421 stop:798 length:378 start_codon:yes stop_codon:yes gene_type:complete